MLRIRKEITKDYKFKKADSTTNVIKSSKIT
jgi:hypothetical protein